MAVTRMLGGVGLEWADTLATIPTIDDREHKSEET